MELTYDDLLAHYGVKGMKWGVRQSKREALQKVRNHAKSQTTAGKRKYRL